MYYRNREVTYSSISITGVSCTFAGNSSPLIYIFVISVTALLWIVMLDLNLRGDFPSPLYVTKIVSLAPGAWHGWDTCCLYMNRWVLSGVYTGLHHPCS